MGYGGLGGLVGEKIARRRRNPRREEAKSWFSGGCTDNAGSADGRKRGPGQVVCSLGFNGKTPHFERRDVCRLQTVLLPSEEGWRAVTDQGEIGAPQGIKGTLAVRERICGYSGYLTRKVEQFTEEWTIGRWEDPSLAKKTGLCY